MSSRQLMVACRAVLVGLLAFLLSLPQPDLKGQDEQTNTDKPVAGAPKTKQQVITSEVLKIKEREAVDELGRAEYTRQMNLVKKTFRERFPTANRDLLVIRADLSGYKFGVSMWYIGVSSGESIAWIAVDGEQVELFGWAEGGQWESAPKWSEMLAAVALSQMERVATEEIRSAKKVADQDLQRQRNLPRTWRSQDGAYSVKARMLRRSGEQVVLEKEDGSTIEVDIHELSQVDRDFIEKFDNDVADPEKNTQKTGNAADGPGQ